MPPIAQSHRRFGTVLALALAGPVLAQTPQEARRVEAMASTVRDYRRAAGEAEKAMRTILEERPRIAQLRTKVAELRRRLATLVDERREALDQMRAGKFCSECDRPAVQIERETGQSFEAHLRSVNGHAIASQELIDAKDREYQRKIDAAYDAVTKVDFELQDRERRCAEAEHAAPLAIDAFSRAAGWCEALQCRNQAERRIDESATFAGIAAAKASADVARRAYERAERAHSARWPEGTDYRRLPITELDEIRRSLDALARQRQAAVRALEVVDRQQRALTTIRATMARADEAHEPTIDERIGMHATLTELAEATGHWKPWWTPPMRARGAAIAGGDGSDGGAAKVDPIEKCRQALTAMTASPADHTSERTAFAARTELHDDLTRRLRGKVADLVEGGLLNQALDAARRGAGGAAGRLQLGRITDTLQELSDRALTFAHRVGATGKTDEAELTDEERIEEDLFRKGSAAMRWNPARALREFGDRGFEAPGLVGDRLLQELEATGNGRQASKEQR